MVERFCDDRPAVIGKGDPGRLGHQRPGAVRHLQLDFGGPLPFAPLAGFFAQLLQRPDPPLVTGAAGLDPLPDPDLLLGQLLVEQRLTGDLRLQQRLAPLHEFVVAAGKGIDPPPVQFGHPVGQPPGKGAVMGDEQHRLDVLGEKLLQPEDGVDVEVVGRLVQNQDIRGGNQGAGQQHPALGPAGKRGELGLGIQIQPVQHPLHLLMQVPAVILLQLFLQRFQPGQQLVAAVMRQFVADMVVFRQHGGSVAHAGGDHIKDVSGQPLRHILGKLGHLQPLLALDLAALRRQFAADQFQQCRFAAAVAPHQAEPVARLDLQVDTVEKRWAAKGQGYVAKGYECHGYLIVVFL